jgi:hypothetical protein
VEEMSDGAKKGFARVLQWVPLLALVVAVTSLIFTFAARKKELTCTLIGTTKLVSVDVGGIHPDLKVEFHGDHVQSLTRMSFSLKNTGAAAVKAEDVREPVHLKYPASVKILSATVDKTGPQEFAFGVKAAPETSEIQCQFPLLNAGDEAIFSVYLINSEPAVPTFSGRIVDVPKLIFDDTSTQQVGLQGPIVRSYAMRTVLFYTLSILAGSLAGISFVMAIIIPTEYFKLERWKHKWREKYRQKVAEELQNFNKTSATPFNVRIDQFETLQAHLPAEVRNKVSVAGIPFPDATTLAGSGRGAITGSIIMLAIAVAFIYLITLFNVVLKP